MKFCSFSCKHADNAKAQHAACLAFNAVWCIKLEKPIEKGSPCAVELEISRSKVECAEEISRRD